MSAGASGRGASTMGCTAFLKETIPNSTLPDINNIVLNLQRNEQRSFFGYGVWETTAVMVSIFVAGFALVRDPTGMQHAHDLDEYSVYRQWRTAMYLLIGDIVFTAAVLVHQRLNCWTGKDIFWLLALMVTPWAPLAGTVRATVRAWPQVRSMMQSRSACNSLTAVMREGLFLGYPGLSTRAAAKYVFDIPELPPMTLPRLDDDVDADRLLKVRIEAVMATSSGLPLTKAALLVGPQLKELSSFWRLCYKIEAHLDRILDPLAHSWTTGGVVLPRNPFEELVDSRAQPRDKSKQPRDKSEQPCDESEQPRDKLKQRQGSDRSPAPRKTCSIKLVRLLDIIDRFQLGGTVSEQRYLALQSNAVCPRCIMAVRAAVETFLESTSRQHAGVRAKDWFTGVTVQWCGGVEVCLGVMWVSCFGDNTGMRVDGDPRRGENAPRAGSHAKPVSTTTMTSWFLLFLFLTSRSLLGQAEALAKVERRLLACLDRSTVMERFWASFRATLRRSSRIDDHRSKAQSNRAVEQLMRNALAAMVDEEATALVSLLCDCLIDTTDYPNASEYLGLARLCDVTTCVLHLPTSMVTFTRQQPPPKRRLVRPRPPAAGA